MHTKERELEAKRARRPEDEELTRRLGFEYNGMILHEYYFSSLKPANEPEPSQGSALADALVKSFGSVKEWQADFQAIGEMPGVGWVILFQDPATDRLTNHWITLHQDGVPAGFKPLLVMDVWEHAFMRDYKATGQVYRRLLPKHRLADGRTSTPGRGRCSSRRVERRRILWLKVSETS